MPASLLILWSALPRVPNGAASAIQAYSCSLPDAPLRLRTASPSIVGPPRHPAHSHLQCRQVRIARLDSSSGQRATARDEGVRVLGSATIEGDHVVQVAQVARTSCATDLKCLGSRHRSFPSDTHSPAVRRQWHVSAEKQRLCSQHLAPSESDADGTLAAIGGIEVCKGAD